MASPAQQERFERASIDRLLGETDGQRSDRVAFASYCDYCRSEVIGGERAREQVEQLVVIDERGCGYCAEHAERWLLARAV
jgi:hypothetical protein